MKQCVLFGSGAVSRLPRLLDRLGARRLFLVTGRSSFERCGAAGALAVALRGREVTGRFCEFSENPKFEDVLRGIELFRAAPPDAVVAVGGGSPLDMAKLVKGLAGQDADPMAVVLGRAPVARPGCPLVAVPTTSGSGSEATHFAVVYVDRAKYSVASAGLRPDAAVVDPALTASLSPALTAVTGMDAFSQAVESFWSVNSTAESKALARRAIVLILQHLPAAVHTPTMGARRGMSKAAHLAGRAIDVTKTTGAHAMSYPLTSYFGVPHGHAVAITLGQWLVYNSQTTDEDVVDSRGAQYVRAAIAELVSLMGCADAPAASRRIEALVASVGLETRLGALGITAAKALEVVVPNVNAERIVNNPRAISTAGLSRLLQAAC
jgi:alcohol dehydrogenase